MNNFPACKELNNAIANLRGDKSKQGGSSVSFRTIMLQVAVGSQGTKIFQ